MGFGMSLPICLLPWVFVSSGDEISNLSTAIFDHVTLISIKTCVLVSEDNY